MNNSNNEKEPTFAELLKSADISIEKKGIIEEDKRNNRPKDNSIKAEIDLHEMIQEKALKYTRDFLDSCYNTGKSPVRIITGKGEGILQKAVWQYLSVNPDRLVSSFSHPGISEGGSGAIDVWLKKFKI